MGVVRIVSDLKAADPDKAAAFYAQLLDLERIMDLGWVTTLAQSSKQGIQLNLAREGGSGAPVPALSIEVDDLDQTHSRATEMGATIVYPLTTEPWGVRRFFLRDLDGHLINILSHTSAET